MIPKVIIAGSRSFSNEKLLEETLSHLYGKFECVCGEARGADMLGKLYAQQKGFPVKSFPADWDGHGKAAGYLRNKQMAEYADEAVVFWDGTSRGAKHMIDIMQTTKKPCVIIRY